MLEDKTVFNTQNGCLGCSFPESAPVFTGYGFDDAAENYNLVQCNKCALVRVDPLLSPEELGRHYAFSYYGKSNKSKFTPWVESLVRYANSFRARQLARFLGSKENSPSRTPRVLDIGCGRGNFLRSMQQMGFDCYGIEIPSFPLPPSEKHLTFLSGTVETVPLENQSFDAISIWHVLEHVPNPERVMGKIATLLKPQGVLAIAVPNFGSIQSRLFGRHWFHLDLPRHLYHFSEESLLDLMKSQGLTPFLIRTNSWDQNLFGFIQSVLNALLPDDPNLLFSFLKKKSKEGEKGSFVRLKTVFSVLVAGILFPLSLIENGLSVLFGKGATLIVYARKE